MRLRATFLVLDVGRTAGDLLPNRNRDVLLNFRPVDGKRIAALGNRERVTTFGIHIRDVRTCGLGRTDHAFSRDAGRRQWNELTHRRVAAHHVDDNQFAVTNEGARCGRRSQGVTGRVHDRIAIRHDAGVLVLDDEVVHTVAGGQQTDNRHYSRQVHDIHDNLFLWLKLPLGSMVMPPGQTQELSSRAANNLLHFNLNVKHTPVRTTFWKDLNQLWYYI